jgi:electron transfer flavoprotein alpha subunit
MNMLSKNWLVDAIGACAMLGGLALLVVAATSGDVLGHSVGALVGAGLAGGLLGCFAKEVAARRDVTGRGASRVISQANHAPACVMVMIPPVADATASEFDECEQATFAPVVSLTEAQVERQRERQRQTRRATLNRA